MTFVMFDSITVGNLPPNGAAYAGYVGGSWPDFAAEVAAFGAKRVLSVAVNAGEDAQCLDIENGDATVSQAPAWFQRQLARGVPKPVLYTNLAQAQALVNTMTAIGIARSRYLLWTAHYLYMPHICNQACGLGFVDEADGTQWTDRAAGMNSTLIDQSQITQQFLDAITGDPPPTPVDPPAEEEPDVFIIQTPNQPEVLLIGDKAFALGQPADSAAWVQAGAKVVTLSATLYEAIWQKLQA